MRLWSPALQFSMKTFLAAMMALGLSFYVGLPFPFWAMTTVYITSNPLSGATRSKAVFRLMGTFLGACVAVWLVPWLVQNPVLLTFALALWVGFCLVVSLLDRSPRSYIMMLAGYTAAIIAFPSVDRPEAIFDTAVARVTEISLGIICATVVHSIVLPSPVSDAMRARLLRWLDAAEGWLLEVLAETMPEAAGEDRRHLAVDVVEMELMATHLPYDTSHWREKSRFVRTLLQGMLTLIPLLSGLADRRHAMTRPGAPPPPAAVARGIARASAFVKDGARWEQLPAVQADLEALAESELQDHWQGLLAESFLIRLAQAVSLLSECRQMLLQVDNPALPMPAPLRELARATRQQKLHSDVPFALLSGMSATLAIVIYCAIWIASGWADGAGAAAMTAVFCCLFATLDNPVPAILRFGEATMAALPLGALYLFAILPRIEDFWGLCVALAPALIIIGWFIPQPRWAAQALAFAMSFCGSMALQETFTADFAHFLNANFGQLVAVLVATSITGIMRSIGADAAVARLTALLLSDLARLAGGRAPPERGAVLARMIDQLALITLRQEQAQGDGSHPTVNNTGLREVRLAMNLLDLQRLRTDLDRRPRVAVVRVLHTASAHFARARRQPIPLDPDPALLVQIDRALTYLLGCRVSQPAIRRDLSVGIASMVSLRRAFFPMAPGFADPADLKETLA